MSNRSGGPGPPLFSVFCFSKRPPARHPEVARPPTDPEIKNVGPRDVSIGVAPLGTRRGVLSLSRACLAHTRHIHTIRIVTRRYKAINARN